MCPVQMRMYSGVHVCVAKKSSKFPFFFVEVPAAVISVDYHVTTTPNNVEGHGPAWKPTGTSCHKRVGSATTNAWVPSCELRDPLSQLVPLE